MLSLTLIMNSDRFTKCYMGIFAYNYNMIIYDFTNKKYNQTKGDYRTGIG